MAWLIRLFMMGLLMAALRAALRWAPTLGVRGGQVALWPGVLLAWALRRWGLPALERRWPNLALVLRWSLRAVALGVTITMALLAPEGRQAILRAYIAGVLAPLALVVGAPIGQTLSALLGAMPLFLGLGVLVAVGWPWLAHVVRSGVRARKGRDGSRTQTDNGQRTTSPRVDFPFRPVPTQQIVERDFGPLKWHVAAFGGPELLVMLCGASGSGKTEVWCGQKRAQLDGEAFCGQATSPLGRTLLLSEMGPRTIKELLLRWGFREDDPDPAMGWLHAVRLRLTARRGGPGYLIDVVHAAEVYAPDEEGARTDWPRVVAKAREWMRTGKYDELAIDTLAEWMGGDGNGEILETLGRCRSITHTGAAVTVFHHTPRADPTRPRGGGAIDAQLDIGWSIYGIGEKWGKRWLHDPVRILAPFKTRYQESTPERLTVEYVPGVAAKPEEGSAWRAPAYRLLETPAAPAAPAVPSAPTPAPESTPSLFLPVAAMVAPAPVPPQAPVVAPPQRALPPQARQVWEALCALPHGGTVKQLVETTGLPRQRVDASLKLLCGLPWGWARPAGTVPTSGGGPPATRFAARSSRASIATPHRADVGEPASS